MHAKYFRLGGVHQDLPPELIDDIYDWCDPFLKVCDDIEGLLTNNRIFKQRNVDIGVITLKQGFDLGFSGVMVRGSGAAWDLRKSQPYERYEEFDFDIPIGKNGDCYDRYLIRMEEMRQSVRIMKKACEKLRSAEGAGPYAALDKKVVPPKRSEMKRSMEGLIHHFKLYTEGVPRPRRRSVCRRRSTQGRVRRLPGGGWFQQTLSLQDPRARLPASGRHGLHEPRPHARRRVSAIIGSLDIVFGEIDR
jgi:NADH-quinone oxidoreductase subunit D